MRYMPLLLHSLIYEASIRPCLLPPNLSEAGVVTYMIINQCVVKCVLVLKPCCTLLVDVRMSVYFPLSLLPFVTTNYSHRYMESIIPVPCHLSVYIVYSAIAACP